MDDHELHYRFPPAKAYKLNKCLYMIRNDAAFAKQVLEDFDAAVKPLALAPEEAEAVRSRDQAKLVDLGAHPLLAFLAIYKLNLTKEPREFTYF
jgi:aromatic-ring opening dioxygenase LigAB LigA subunit